MDLAFEQISRVRPFVSLGLLMVFVLWELIAPAISQFQRHRERLAHAGRNLLCGVLNSLVIGAGFLWLWKLAIDSSSAMKFGLLWQFDLGPATHAVLSILLLDMWTYFWHRLNHTVPLLWRFHCLHHSDTQMDVTTATRFHTGEILFSSLLRAPLLFLLGVQLWHLAVYEAAMFAVVQFHHANIQLPEKLAGMAAIPFCTPSIEQARPAETN